VVVEKRGETTVVAKSEARGLVRGGQDAGQERSVGVDGRID
jgi:hypothetical protein